MALFSAKTDDGGDDDNNAVVVANGTTAPAAGTEEATTTATTTATAAILLNVVAVLWGTQHAVIKSVLQDSGGDPAQFTLLRFGLAALFASATTPGVAAAVRNLRPAFRGSNVDEGVDDGVDVDVNGEALKTAWRWGAEMGLWMFLGFSFQAIGLEFTTAQRSGFLLYLNVKFVPFFARIFLGRSITLPTLLSALAAFTGTALLAWSGSGDGGVDDGGSSSSSVSALIHMNVGDLWSIAAAAASAMFILRLEKASSEVRDAAALNSACLWVVTVLAGVWTLTQSDPAAHGYQYMLDGAYSIASTHGLELLYLSGVTTALANWIQTKAQREISAERASVIYAMDPVYGAVFANLLLGETLDGVAGWVGAAIITIAAATNAFLEFPVSSSLSTTTSAEKIPAPSSSSSSSSTTTVFSESLTSAAASACDGKEPK